MMGLRRVILSLTALLLMSGVALANPAYAKTGSDDSIKTSAAQSDAEIANEPVVNDLTTKFKEQAKENLAEKKAQVKEQTQAKRMQSCEARKTNLENRMSNSVRHANQLKSVFDKIYQKTKDFHDNKQLNTPNYDSLVSTVDAAKTDAETNIAALAALQVNVDCSQTTVADTVNTFQTAVKSTRDSLKAYRASITDLIKALKSANSSTTDSTTGESQ